VKGVKNGKKKKLNDKGYQIFNFVFIYSEEFA
jgi:hypothetical protein